MAVKQKKFVSQPTIDGMFEVAVYCDQKSNYIPLKGAKFATSAEAELRAKELNEAEQEDPANYELNLNDKK